MGKKNKNAPDLETIMSRLSRPKKAVVTGGMPYANGPIHLGHLAGAFISPDIHARWMKMLIGSDNVLFVCGTDDHGSTSELSAIREGVSTRELIDSVHAKQLQTLKQFNIGLDIYSGTSSKECFPIHKELSQDFMRRMHKNGLLTKRSSVQWYDPSLNRFLQDRFVTGECPNPKCENKAAYGEECDDCGAKYQPSELINPKSALSDAVPEQKETKHLWLNMWDVSDVLREWIQGRRKDWRKAVFNEVINTVLPSVSFDREFEDQFKSFKSTLPKHKCRYAPGKKMVAQFESMTDMESAIESLKEQGISTELVDGWAHRSFTRDVSWGIPVPEEIDPELAGKTLYVWPDSLIAPISFTKLALQKKGKDPEEYKEYWTSPDAKIYQFLGQDNVYFYVLMQGAMWVATQEETNRAPIAGEFQFSDVFGAQHLLVDGDKMSKSKGNFVTGDQLFTEKGYTADQIRYFIATLDLADTSSNFGFAALDERNRFLAGPLNAAFEKPISACHSKFSGTVPEGEIVEKVQSETMKVIQRYLNSMQKASYIVMLGAIENYARQINSMFTQFKPHDDRFPEEQRRHALYSSFYILKNIMIMLYPFVPETMDTLRQSLNLPPEVFSVDELGKPIPAGHKIGEKKVYFPAVEETS